jgi:abortive infection bacteriophage resistance protein
MRPFQLSNSEHQFKSGITFTQLTKLYEFDRRLRLLVIDAIERTEVAVRARISNELGNKYGSHWYLNREHFKKTYHHERLIKTIQEKQHDALEDYNRECLRIEDLKTSDKEYKTYLKQKPRQESYARHYALTYHESELMPGWAMLEEVSLGELSHFYKGLAKDKDKKAIAHGFDLYSPLLESWLHTITL